MGTNKLSGKPGGRVTCDGLASHPGEVAILLVTSCYGNWDKLGLCGPLGSCADFTLLETLLEKAERRKKWPKKKERKKDRKKLKIARKMRYSSSTPIPSSLLS